MANIEEKVEDFYKELLDNIGVKRYSKTDRINDSIYNALNFASSKSGGNGKNYPDIRILLDNGLGRRIPVMIEAKGVNKRLEKLDKNGEIIQVQVYSKDKTNKDGEIIHKSGELDYSAIVNYAVNGAVHYGNAILDSEDYSEVIIVGVNGSKLVNNEVVDLECKAYYMSKKNNRVPKLIEKITDKDWNLFKDENLNSLYAILDNLNLTDREIEELTKRTEATLEEKIKAIHQSLYEDSRLKISLSTNEKLYLFCGLIMAGLKTKGVATLNSNMLNSNDNEKNNDGTIILNSITSFLYNRNCSDDKVEMIMSLLNSVFKKKVLWQPHNGESILKTLFNQIKGEIIPCLESNLHLDFTGKILNSLNDWVSIDNDAANDVVLTPRYVTSLMTKIARTNKDSFVWDKAMGSAGFLVSAMDIMIKDAKDKITDKEELELKIRKIKENQLLGIEILGNIYILAVLNMILMGDGSSNILNGNSHEYNLNRNNFPANVFLLNPPYSAEGKGFIFVEEALNQMSTGYACILIQENAGSGQGGEYTKNILKNNSLVASIHMPCDLFGGKASVQTCIYVFQVARPHEEDDLVKFIDFSVDGYSRQNRKKSNQEVNLRDTDDAIGRYAEVEAIVLGKKPKTSYYTKENGLYIEDTISLNGNDWTYSQHKKIDLTPTEDDFRKTVADYLAWKVANVISEK